MTDTSTYCCNCAPGASFPGPGFSSVCGKCQADPYRINLLKACKEVNFLLCSNKISRRRHTELIVMLCDLKSKCDTNPFPVIIGIILTELYPDGGKVLLVQRAIKPSIGGWALVSGFIIDQLSWQENLRKEAMEEASVTIDMGHMEPLTFSNNTPQTNLMLNFAVVKPVGVIRINDFAPDHETSDRMEFRFSKEVRPPFCFRIHEEMFNMWCQQHFGW